MLPRRPSANARSRSPAPARRLDPRRDLRQPDAVAARARGPPPEPAQHARLRRTAVHRLRRAARRPPLRRRPRDRRRHRRATRASPSRSSGTRRGATPSRRSSATSATRGPEGYRKALRVMQMAQKFSRPVVVLHRHAGGLPGHRVGGARRRRSDRPQPARDDDARSADHRHRLRRRRQRRRARHRHRRPRADAGVRGLQRDPAGGLRGDPVARREQEGRSGRRR